MESQTLPTQISQNHDVALTNAVYEGRRNEDTSTLICSAAELEGDARPSAMSTLLPELLSMIFVIYAGDNHELADLRWTRLLFVCRRWYDVGLRTPELWSHIDLYNVRPGPDAYEADTRDLRRIKVQMSRAGHRALTVRIGLIRAMSERKNALLSALWTPPSLFSLTLDEDSDYSTARNVMEILGSQLHTALTHLELVCQKGGTPCSIPDVVLGDYTPRLRSLSVDCMLFDWAAIRGLCSLHVSYSNSFRIAFGLSDILDTLARCPLLEHLQFDLPGTFRPKPNSTLKHTVLSHIDYICLEGSNEFCDNLLHALKGLPCTAMIAIEVVPDSNSISPMLPSSFSHLKAHASQSNAPIIQHISLVQESDHHASKPFQFCLSGDLGLDLSICSPFEWMHEPLRPNSFISASTTIHGDAYIAALHAMMQQWPVTHVTHLDMRMNSAIDKDLWVALFGYLPALTTVVVRPESHAATALFDTLDEYLQRSGRHIVKSVILDLTQTGALIALPVSRREAFARRILRRVVSHCAAAASANAPLDTIEVVNDERGYLSLFDCGEFSKGLARGFIYGGVLYTEREDVYASVGVNK